VADGFSAQTLDAVDEVFAAFHRTGSSPGMAYGVVVGDTVVHSGGVGVSAANGHPQTPDASTVFRIASMTKSFTAAAILLLRDAGLLALDDSVGLHVPELAWSAQLAGVPPITLRMLLTMSSGLPTDDPWADREESMAAEDFSRLLQRGFTFSAVPGTEFQYSNLGYAILGRVITNIAGVPFHDVVRDRLLRPLELTSTAFAAADVPADRLAVGHHRHGDGWDTEPFSGPGSFSPLGGLFSSVTDLARWVAGFTASFDTDRDSSTHPLTQASRREMQQIHRFSGLSTTADQRPRAMGYGFGLSIVTDAKWGDIVGHSGGYPGYGSNMRWHRASGIGVIALGNARYVAAREPASAALEVLLESVAAPAKVVTKWKRTVEMQRAAERLLVGWDDTAADEVFAPNMDLDQPRSERRDEVSTAVARLGAIDLASASVDQSVHAAEADWWLTAEQGRVRVEIMLTPEAEPRIQSLDVTVEDAAEEHEPGAPTAEP
jgi:CubicO group peptidase (beta-lactamase class C family)